jgi:hypothetical protein
VAKGFTQKKEEDYFDTYSPVARLPTIRVLLALAAAYKLLVHQMDVKTIFLNGELEEEIYMQQLEGFVVKGQESKVCCLIKSLYDLKQAPIQWHEKFNNTLTTIRFCVHKTNKCVYYRFSGSKGVILCLYVDDILIFRTKLEAIMETKVFLFKNFDMKDLGEADVILNIKLIKGEDGITLSQSHYVEKVLTRFGHMDYKPVATPYDPSYTLCKYESKPVNQLLYSQIIGSLMYLSSATRPNISYAVWRLARYSANLGDRHWVALYKVLRYLKGVMNLGIKYTEFLSVLEGFSDAN